MTEKLTPDEELYRKNALAEEEASRALGFAELLASRTGETNKYLKSIRELIFTPLSLEKTLTHEDRVDCFVELNILKDYESNGLYKMDGVTLKQLHERIVEREKLLENQEKRNQHSPTKNLGSKDQKRVEEVKRHLTLLEETAKNKNIPFDKHNLKCSKVMLLEWLDNKPGSLFSIKKSAFDKVWGKTEYKCCSRVQVDKDFFKKIQG